MLAALILEVLEWKEEDALKVSYNDLETRQTFDMCFSVSKHTKHKAEANFSFLIIV